MNRPTPLIYLTLPAYPYPAALDRLRTLEAGCQDRYQDSGFGFTRALGHTLYDRPELGQEPTMEQLRENARRRIVGDGAGTLNGYDKPASLWYFGAREQQVTDEIGWAEEAGLPAYAILSKEEAELHHLGVLSQHRSMGAARKRLAELEVLDRLGTWRDAWGLLHAYFEGMGSALDIRGTDYAAVRVGAQFNAKEHLERMGLIFARACGVLRLAFSMGLTNYHLLVLRSLMVDGRSHLATGDYLELREDDDEHDEALRKRVRKFEADGKALVQIALRDKQEETRRKAEEEGEVV